MFKKAFQIVVTFGVLLGGYQAYLLGFAALTDRIGAPTSADGPWVPAISKTAKEATRLAVGSFGKDHFTSEPDLGIRMYDAKSGYYIYARNYKRLDNGKKFEFWPFAIIWMSKDGKSRKTATSERALVELNEPMGLMKPGQEALHVIEARLEGTVEIRDDKATLADRRDDLVVGPLPYIQYTEKTNPPAIMSVSDVRLVDRDMVVTGYDLLILLRKKEGEAGSPSGFDAETAYLKKNVDIVVKDVGRSGVLPGTTKANAPDTATPLHLTNEGEMRIDFPDKVKPMRPDLVGPPQLEGPTYATFHRLVVVRRGIGALMDELTCDTLKLTLLPTPKQTNYAPRPDGGTMIIGAATLAPGAGGVTPHVGGDATGPLTELAIREANAKGFSVWLTSTAQGIKARCDELIYKKLVPASPDETYLRGNTNRQIVVTKTDRAPSTGTESGPITSVMTLRSADAKIFDDGKGGAASTVVARGPGRIESRPAADKPPEHAATWNIDLVMRTIPLVAAKPDGTPAQTKRIITLTGDPKLEEFEKAMKLEAKRWVIVSLMPKPKAKGDGTKKALASAAAPAKSSSALGSGSYQIEWMRASENVRLTSPGKTMIARDELNARFEQVEAIASSKSEAAPVVEEPKLVVEPNPARGVPSVDGPAFAAKAPEAPAKPNEPDVFVTAHKVWATIHQSEGKSELSDAMLRGQVTFHQDPAPDKKRGTDVTGEALDVKSVGVGDMKFMVMETEDPSAADGRTRLTALGGPTRPKLPPAKIVTEDYVIEGPDIRMDQSIDFAEVRGEGRLTQLAERGFLNDKGVQERVKAQARVKPDKDKDKANTKIPFTIAWKDSMRFSGKSVDLQRRPAGKAEFRGEVVAKMEDGVLAADEIDTYTTKPVSFKSRMKSSAKANRPKADPNRNWAVNREDVPVPDDDPVADESPTELAYLDARNAEGKPKPKHRDVTAVSIKRDPESGQRIEVQRITGDEIRYDKRTGDYTVPGKGLVYLWRRSAIQPTTPTRPTFPGGPLPQATRPRTTPIANQTKPAPKPAQAKPFGDWELTKIEFDESMSGRFGTAKDTEELEDRTADFYGAVQVITAPVSNALTDLNFDSHPRGFKRMTADSLRIVSVPPPPGVKDVAARTFVTAENNAQATTETHTVSADILKFDSEKDLFNAYGLHGRDVVIVNQTNPGQPSSVVRSEAAVYNHKTGAAEPINPNTIQLLDASSGNRPGVEGPAGPGKPKPRNQRPSLRPPPSSHLERRGFGSGASR